MASLLVANVHETYKSLKYKPNQGQFTVLAAFILVLNQESLVISLATGTKCLPTEKYPLGGEAMHDSHAEILARRGANRWFFHEILRCCSSTQYESPWILRSHSNEPLFALRPNIRVCFYVSTLPCGDASTSYVASMQSSEMAALKEMTRSAPISETVARGRNNYGLFSILRTKPGRSDSPPTLCMSCSDKIARWSVLGIIGALGCDFLTPIYIDEIIIGEIEQKFWPEIKKDCARAFFQRVQNTTGLPTDYDVATPTLSFTLVPFVHSRSVLGLQGNVSSNESLCFVAGDPDICEVVINGIKRGVAPKHRFREKSRTMLCKMSQFALYISVRRALNLEELPPTILYFQAKLRIPRYQYAKNSLLGPGGPLFGWMCSGAKWEKFNLQGELKTSSDEENCVPKT